jgi:hypothetical protein
LVIQHLVTHWIPGAEVHTVLSRMWWK